ncbi:AbiH family protein [uncultured Draconibacterium sp.]|uniref:AbiH family protein n=1 Tax=uncultured Draconibacterium sp. TaxID=1573823 RepID=UPI0029C7509E|nr:AbiH family protein [uncultured Draconibacterium sp.]
MRNLVIIGNGFDLAHKLNTRYIDFQNDVRNNPKKYDIQHIDLVDNKLIKSLIENKKEMWSDIEHTYYEILKNFNNKKYIHDTFGNVWEYNNIKELNQDFDEIKKWLSKYLENEESKFKVNKNYEIFFDSLSKQKSVILNFNYTKTVKEYIERKNLDIEIIQIHGELNNPANPIIFGFAASNEESKELLDENDNNYVRNIKKFNYLFTNNEHILKNHLESAEFNLFVLGHSCGVSDKLILSQILNSKGIFKIYPFYFKDRMGYFETMVNIDRIIDDYSKTDLNKASFKKLVSFPDAYPMPQMNLDEYFIDYLDKILKMKLPKEKSHENHKQAINSLRW